jgi:hypothetical protein
VSATVHAVAYFVGRAPKTVCGIYCDKDRMVADPAFATCKRCHPPKSAHHATYRRRPLGRSPQGGGTYYGYTITCSCGWTQKLNENKREAVKWFNDHVREERRKSGA